MFVPSYLIVTLIAPQPELTETDELYNRKEMLYVTFFPMFEHCSLHKSKINKYVEKTYCRLEDLNELNL